MPKIVDHDERRREIAQVVWALAAREGIKGLSARKIAARGGWSLGALRHYFVSQDELVSFAVESMLDNVTERVLSELNSGRPGLARCQRAAECLLPLDEERLGQVRAWLALAMDGDEEVSPELEELRQRSWVGERYLCRIVVAELRGLPAPHRERPLPRVAEQQATTLHTLIDGLSLQGAASPHHLPPHAQQQQLRHHLKAIAQTS